MKAYLSPAVVTALMAAGSQPLDSDLTAIAALSTTAFGRALLALADGPALLAAAGGQPLDSDLTAIAALSTTAYGRAFLALADQAALVALLPGYQPSSANLTSVAAITTGVANAGKVVGITAAGALELIVVAAGLAGMVGAYTARSELALYLADIIAWESAAIVHVA